MIKQYLLRTKQELLEKRIDYKKQLKKSELSIKENLEFIHLMEESQDQNYNSFFPQNYRTITNTENIKKLKEERKAFEKRCKQIEEEIKNVDNKIEEIDYLITICKQGSRKNDDLQEIANEKDYSEIEWYQKFEKENKITAEQILNEIENLNAISHKTELCYKFMDMDPKRSKIEMKNILNEMQEVMKRLIVIQSRVSPLYEDNMNLESGIYKIIDYIRSISQVKVLLKKRGKLKNFSDVMNQAVVRIIQYICEMMVQSRATKIIIELENTSEKIFLKIVSNLTNIEKDKEDVFYENMNRKIVDDLVSILSGKLEMKISEENINYFIEFPVSQ